MWSSTSWTGEAEVMAATAGGLPAAAVGAGRLSAAAAAAALVAAACGGEAGAARAVVRDSAGVTIVENRARAWAEEEGWTVSEAPAVEIGVLEGPPEYQLFRVADATRLSDGRLVVANAGTHELRFYDPGGDFLTRAGAEGEGPGEFQDLAGVFLLPGDSILAYDWRLRRLSVFGPDGAFLRSHALQPLEGLASPRVEGRFADGSLLVRGGSVYSMRDELSTGVSRRPTVYYGYAADGSGGDSLVSVPGPEAWVKTRDQGFMVTSLMFGRGSAQGVGGDLFWVGTTDAYEVRAYTPAGRLVRIVRLHHEPVPVTEADVEAEVERRLAGVEDEETRRERGARYREMQTPRTMPAYATLEVARDGHLWIRRHAGPRDEGPALWDVFEPEGSWLGTVPLPEGLRVLEIGEAYVLGSWRDELDVERVRLHRLTRR